MQPHWVRPASKGVEKAERAHGKRQAISPLSSGHGAKGSLHVTQGPHGCQCADENYTSLTGVNWKSNRSFVFSDRHVPNPQPFVPTVNSSSTPPLHFPASISHWAGCTTLSGQSHVPPTSKSDGTIYLLTYHINALQTNMWCPRPGSLVSHLH